MKTMKYFLRLSVCLIVILGLSSCSDDDNQTPILLPPGLNIVETASADSNLSSLVAALQAADGDLVNVLSGQGPFTVLAPTNEAFSRFLMDNGFADLSAVPTDVLQQILLNHVISGNIPSSSLLGSSGYTKTSATGAADQAMSLFYNGANGSVVFNGGATVTTADVSASNGTVHVINEVIGLPTVVDLAAANPNYSSLAAALGAADGNLDTVLAGAGPFTVLAPDNDAFTTFLDGTPLGDVDTAVLAQILLNHVLGANILASTLVNAGAGYNNTLATGAGGNPMSIYFNTSDGVRFNGVASVADNAADIVAANGIIHGIGAVIGLPTVVTFATADPNFSSLAAALTTQGQPDFVSTLSTPDGTNPAPFTVFAPVNSAFTALLDSNAAWNDLTDINSALLTSVLQHHVVTGTNAVSSGLNDGYMVPTLEGDMITINLPGNDGNPAKITDGSSNTDIDIIAVDVQAANGVIHAIESVLIPNVN